MIDTPDNQDQQNTESDLVTTEIWWFWPLLIGFYLLDMLLLFWCMHDVTGVPKH
jgi:hypothetical protein